MDLSPNMPTQVAPQAPWPVYSPLPAHVPSCSSATPWYERKEATTTLIPVAASAQASVEVPKVKPSALAGLGTIALLAACAAFGFGFQAARANMPQPLMAHAAISFPSGLEKNLITPEPEAVWVYDLPIATLEEPVLSSPSARPPLSLAPAIAADQPPAPIPLAAALHPFDRAAALAALQNASSAARVCLPSASRGAPVSVRVTFGPDGHVLQAAVTSKPFANTPMGGCISNLIGTAWMPEFEGTPVTIDQTLMLQ